jgi:hypothetical protein
MTDNIQATDNLFENESIQMAFSVAGSRELNLLINKPAEQVCDFLAHQIARKPMDLTAHVQRIKLAAEHDLAPALKGALLDLCIVLGARGYDLRKRMFSLASETLPQGSIQYLADGLENGIEANDSILDPGISVLCKSITGSTDFIKAARAKDELFQDPLEQALAYIECSQLEEACEVLEKAIHANTSNLEQQALLLDLYRKSDNKTRFSEIYSKSGEAVLLDQQAWLSLADHFDYGR